MYICITIIADFLADTPNWQVLWGKNKYLVNSLYEKSKNKVSLNQMYTVKYLVFSMDKQIN